MKKLFLLLATAAATTGMLQAQNPVIRNQFSADPTARVFNGKVYIYPSHDIPSPVKHLKEWFCMADYHVFTSTNLTHWTDLGVILSQNEIPWVQPDSYSMWAPECVYKNEKYYFYFPSTPKGEGRRGFNIGVATADNPEGPFTPEAEPIKGISGIDPCVLVDTDGEAYIYWSGRGMSVAKLKPNMKELASEPIQVQGLPEGFKEGPYVFKRNGKYYFTFPWVQDKTENLAYAWETALWDRSLSKESSWTNRLSAAGPITTPLRNTTANGIFSIIITIILPTSTRTVRYVSTHFSSTQTVLSKR